MYELLDLAGRSFECRHEVLCLLLQLFVFPFPYAYIAFERFHFIFQISDQPARSDALLGKLLEELRVLRRHGDIAGDGLFPNAVDFVEGSCRVKQALIRDKRYPGLYLLPTAQTRDKSAVNESQMKKLVEHLKEQFDYILLDCPAGIEQGFKNAIAGADRALVVTTPEVSAIRDADRIIGLLEASGFERIDLVINRMRYEMVRRGDMMSVDDVVDILSIPLIGVVPDDENVVIATNQGEPLVGNHTLAGRAYRNICQRILGQETPYLLPEPTFSFWTKVTGIFHKSQEGRV